MNSEIERYKGLLTNIKNRVRQGQLKANLSANAEMLATYWDIGKMIHLQQQQKGWGKGVIPKLASDLKNELAEVKGFSVRNIQMMIQFYNEYSDFSIWQLAVGKLDIDAVTKLSVAQLESNSISQAPVARLKNNSITQLSVAQLQNIPNESLLITKIGWTQHTVLLQKIKDMPIRYWYMQQILEQGWSRDTLVTQIKSKIHERQGALVHNFDTTLTNAHSLWAKQTFKDPYIFDFLTLATEFSERELELELLKHVERFLLELGAGFAFVGRQYKLEISDKEFYIDLLFYHIKMRCFVVIDLKKGDFLPEYAGKMNFYCSAVDDILKHETDKPTIGLILCKGKDRIFAEYALRDVNKPIGVSEYELTQMLPDNLKSSLPSIEDIEKEFFEANNQDN
ncbi:YhcG family protein [Flavobacterium sp. ZS1P70]|uniref:YhcG family protein n=1 Tax=Flavobacterium zhoui TaxID=3230414 RepID=A0ABW6I6S1_9FLAO